MLPAPPPRQQSGDVWEPAALASQRVTSYAGGASARHSSMLVQPASPRTVRQKLEFGAGSRSGSHGDGRDAAGAADAAASLHSTYAARRSVPDPATIATPSAGHADEADRLSLRQPSGAAAESPTQTKLRSLLKARFSTVG